MAIALPDGHPHASLAGATGATGSGARRLRIGIINIMPRLEDYERYLLAPLARAPHAVEPVFIRLASHRHQSSDHEHLARFYRPFDAAVRDAPLDGLIVTGAPVEELAFDEVHYFAELAEILRHARTAITTTLGLCWGGLALGHLVGVGKRGFARKLFGVFDDRVLVADHDLLAAGAFPCAHSRHAGVDEAELEQAALAGEVRPLSRGEHTGYSMFETTDRRYVAHIGHPEYDAARLAFEWHRDRALGRTDVDSPAGLDPDAPSTTWVDHRDGVFSGFVARLAAAAPPAQ